ncbi:MAG: hypothetical protein COB42_06725 [Sulfurimonas sp.]|nr:MAG: hypothetical protein COB42_06725 [Sulfurimonas sp.]
MSRRSARYRANYSGLKYAGGGGGIASIGAAMIGGGLMQDEKNMSENATKKAMLLQEKDVAHKGMSLDFKKKTYKDARMDITKKDAKEEAEEKANVKATKEYWESQGMDVSGMSNNYVKYNGGRVNQIFKDKTSRMVPQFHTLHDGTQVASYIDANGKPVSEITFRPPTKENKKKTAKTDGYIRIPEGISGAEADDYSSKTSFTEDGIAGTWILKDEWAKNEALGKKLNDEI